MTATLASTPPTAFPRRESRDLFRWRNPIRNATLVLGFVYALLIPFHQILRSFTANGVLLAWKEATMLFGFVALLAFSGQRTAPSAWRWTSVLLLCALVVIVIRGAGASVFDVVDGGLTLIGPC